MSDVAKNKPKDFNQWALNAIKKAKEKDRIAREEEKCKIIQVIMHEIPPALTRLAEKNFKSGFKWKYRRRFRVYECVAWDITPGYSWALTEGYVFLTSEGELVACKSKYTTKRKRIFALERQENDALKTILNHLRKL